MLELEARLDEKFRTQPEPDNKKNEVNEARKRLKDMDEEG